MPSAEIPGVESVIGYIAACELDYRDCSETGKYSEEELLERLDGYISLLVHAFNERIPPPRERGGALALETEFYEWRKNVSGSPEARRSAVIRSFLAAETERGGQFRLDRSQGSRIGDHLYAMGREFIDLGMPGHAALVFRSAADLYLPLADYSRRDRSLLSWRRAQRLARPPGLARFFEGLYDAVCGYGYRPFRMLGWMFAVLAVFSLMVWLSGGPGYVRSLHGCLIDFLNPLSFGDLDGSFSDTAQVFLIVESYVGSISMAVFFAFLVRD